MIDEIEALENRLRLKEFLASLNNPRYSKPLTPEQYEGMVNAYFTNIAGSSELIASEINVQDDCHKALYKAATNGTAIKVEEILGNGPRIDNATAIKVWECTKLNSLMEERWKIQDLLLEIPDVGEYIKKVKLQPTKEIYSSPEPKKETTKVVHDATIIYHCPNWVNAAAAVWPKMNSLYLNYKLKRELSRTSLKRKSNLKLIGQLIEASADSHTQSGHGWTALRAAKYYRNPQLLKIIDRRQQPLPIQENNGPIKLSAVLGHTNNTVELANMVKNAKNRQESVANLLDEQLENAPSENIHAKVPKLPQLRRSSWLVDKLVKIIGRFPNPIYSHKPAQNNGHNSTP